MWHTSLVAILVMKQGIEEALALLGPCCTESGDTGMVLLSSLSQSGTKFGKRPLLLLIT